MASTARRPVLLAVVARARRPVARQVWSAAANRATVCAWGRLRASLEKIDAIGRTFRVMVPRVEPR